MGSCLCREEAQDAEDQTNCIPIAIGRMSQCSEPKRPRIENEPVEELILDILTYIATCTDGGEEEPNLLVRVVRRADTDEGWCEVMLGLITAIPYDDPLSLSTIAVIFEYTPLPPRDIIIGFTQSLNLTPSRCALAYVSVDSMRQERNLMWVLGYIAVKFASHNSVHIINDDLLDYLITFLVDERCPILALAALVTLEKLGCTAENVAAVNAALARRLLNPLLPLELLCTTKEYPWRCVGFQARWMLDNLFLFPDRKYSFQTANLTDVNVMINAHDSSHYLKISPDGLEVRTDSPTFETAKATCKVKGGCWYYEVKMITAGVMQIGWATKDAVFDSHEGCGVGDDDYSIAYDGCRRLMWHQGRSTFVNGPVAPWQEGDILGCYLDATKGDAYFSLNGNYLPGFAPAFLSSGDGVFPAASFMADQQCLFNFGSRPFLYPPSPDTYTSLNSAARLLPGQKLIIPRRLETKIIAAKEKDLPLEDRCAICFDEENGFGLDPCGHTGFCARCVLLLEDCPLCRGGIKSIFLQPK